MNERVKMDPTAVAEYLDMSYASIMRLVRNNRIPHFRIGTGKCAHVFFFRDSIDRWMENLEKQSMAI